MSDKITGMMIIGLCIVIYGVMGFVVIKAVLDGLSPIIFAMAAVICVMFTRTLFHGLEILKSDKQQLVK